MASVKFTSGFLMALTEDATFPFQGVCILQKLLCHSFTELSKIKARFSP